MKHRLIAALLCTCAAPGLASAQPGGGEGAQRYGDVITIKGPSEFREQTVAALDALAKTRTGKAILAAVAKAGREGHAVTIDVGLAASTVPDAPTAAAPAATRHESGRCVVERRGKGTGSTIYLSPLMEAFIPNFHDCFPPAVVIGHELIHAVRNARGESLVGEKLAGNATSHEEARAIGVGPYADARVSENALRAELGLPLRRDHSSEVCRRPPAAVTPPAEARPARGLAGSLGR
jgi:hypothetical protein